MRQHTQRLFFPLLFAPCPASNPSSIHRLNLRCIQVFLQPVRGVSLRMSMIVVGDTAHSSIIGFSLRDIGLAEPVNPPVLLSFGQIPPAGSRGTDNNCNFKNHIFYCLPSPVL
ncbi:hypothetical protein I7I53_07481 [Histoplasma capsulatum var. duboisii H88]|uniref:Uncharacterized protein n=1 Tax=Ajellomyces capsulatus (strain H88) TaxID=544711 RepID=A0A8A1LHQ6_AJEC8|nr:hypothetical protein I7I53_07481 [Histoplasma capsulatum var. duboisii H88]